MKQRIKAPFLEELRKIPIIKMTTDKLGISRNTIYRWMKLNKKFKDDVHEALMEGEKNLNEMVESMLVKKALNEEDLRAIMFYLTRRHPKYKQSIENSKQISETESSLDIAERNIRSLLKRGDKDITKFVLERSKPDVYRKIPADELRENQAEAERLRELERISKTTEPWDSLKQHSKKYILMMREAEKKIREEKSDTEEIDKK